MNIFKKLGWFFKQERKRYIIGITFLALTSLANLIPPRVLGLMADQLDQGHISWGQYGMLILAVLAAASFYIFCATFGVSKFGAGPQNWNDKCVLNCSTTL